MVQNTVVKWPELTLSMCIATVLVLPCSDLVLTNTIYLRGALDIGILVGNGMT